MRLRTMIGLLAVAAAFSLTAAPAVAGVFTRSPLQVVSVASPFAGCDISGLAAGGTNFLNAEVEPWVDANPANPMNLIAVWQQDRWSNGGARGLLTAVTHNGERRQLRALVGPVGLVQPQRRRAPDQPVGQHGQ
jgi:hypothetical protein